VSLPGARPHVVVVIVTYNSREVVDGLLSGLPAAFGDVEHEVVVVDNDSVDGTAAALERRGVRVLRSPNLGYSSGINRGVAAAPAASAVLILNPDVRLAPGSAARMVQAMTETGAGIVVPRLTDPDGTLYPSLRREPTIRRWLGLTFTGRPSLSELVTEPDAYRRRHEVDWATGAVMLVDRRLHDQLGGWDESYFLYSEETDFCLRARDLGRPTFLEPTAVAEHIGGGSGRSGHTHAMQMVNRVRLYRRRRGAVLGLVYHAVAIGREGLKAAAGSARSRTSFLALVLPSRRPAQLRATTWVPR
jgi:N-acetylglucosaminyl-diphospho-decaprenol L-rhamnosyltransferase